MVMVKARVTVTSARGDNDNSVYVIGHDYESIQFNYSLPAIRLGKVERGNDELTISLSREALGH